MTSVFSEESQVVVFVRGGVVQAVARRALLDGDMPCIVVDYDDLDIDMCHEDFEREKLGVTRVEFDKSAVYIW